MLGNKEQGGLRCNVQTQSGRMDTDLKTNHKAIASSVMWY
jgi:hypothetical protein